MLLPAATQVQRTASGLLVPVSDYGSVPGLARIWCGPEAGRSAWELDRPWPYALLTWHLAYPGVPLNTQC